jgi:D-sedoheptulose 7-phosphate isomerase
MSPASGRPRIQQFVGGFFDDLVHAERAIDVSDSTGAVIEFRDGMARAVELLATQAGQGRKIMFVGNGASAAISSHQAVDFWKTGGMRAIAFNDPALLTCISNDFSYAQVFEKPIEMFADAGDVLIAVSSSGRSENIVRAAHAARRRDCRIITLSGFERDNPLRALGDLNFHVRSKSYGLVEVTHLGISHCLLDTITAVYGSPPRAPRPATEA